MIPLLEYIVGNDISVTYLSLIRIAMYVLLHMYISSTLSISFCIVKIHSYFQLHAE